MRHIISIIGIISFLNGGIYAVEYHALLVGIEDYQSIEDLSYCVDDVRDMKTSLLNFPNWESIHLVELTENQAGKSNIKAKLQDMKNLNPEDIFVFYFSGHGSKDNSRSYLCPWDTDLSNFGSMISDEGLRDWINQISAKEVIIIDACHSGGVAKGGLIPKGISTLPPDFIPASGGFQAVLSSKLVVIAEGIIDTSSAIMDINNDNKQEVFFACDDGDGDGKDKTYVYPADWNLMWSKDVQEDVQIESCNYGSNIKIAKEGLSIGILAGIYYPNKSVIYRPHRVTLPHTMWKIGISSYYRFSKMTFSILLSYSYTENLNYLMAMLWFPPFLDLSFRLCNLSFLCTFQRKFFRYAEAYIGGGIAFLNADFSYLEHIENGLYDKEKENVTYLSSLITGGLRLSISTHWYMGIQYEMFVSHFIKWGF